MNLLKTQTAVQQVYIYTSAGAVIISTSSRMFLHGRDQISVALDKNVADSSHLIRKQPTPPAPTSPQSSINIKFHEERGSLVKTKITRWFPYQLRSKEQTWFQFLCIRSKHKQARIHYSKEVAVCGGARVCRLAELRN